MTSERLFNNISSKSSTICIFFLQTQITTIIIDFFPEKLSTFTTLSKYREIEFWLFIKEHTNTRRKKLQTAPLRKGRGIYQKNALENVFINNNKRYTEHYKQYFSYGLKRVEE